MSLCSDPYLLICHSHGTLLRSLTAILGYHAQGISQIARDLKRQKRISNELATKIMNVDTAYHVMRHISIVSVDELHGRVMREVTSQDADCMSKEARDAIVPRDVQNSHHTGVRTTESEQQTSAEKDLKETLHTKVDVRQDADCMFDALTDASTMSNNQSYSYSEVLTTKSVQKSDAGSDANEKVCIDGPVELFDIFDSKADASTQTQSLPRPRRCRVNGRATQTIHNLTNTQVVEDTETLLDHVTGSALAALAASVREQTQALRGLHHHDWCPVVPYEDVESTTTKPEPGVCTQCDPKCWIEELSVLRDRFYATLHKADEALFETYDNILDDDNFNETQAKASNPDATAKKVLKGGEVDDMDCDDDMDVEDIKGMFKLLMKKMEGVENKVDGMSTKVDDHEEDFIHTSWR